MESVTLRKLSTRMLVSREKRKAQQTNIVHTSLAGRVFKGVQKSNLVQVREIVNSEPPFLALPFEIRLQIYRAFFPGVGLMIFTHYTKVAEESFEGHYQKTLGFPLCSSCGLGRIDPSLILPITIPDDSQNTPQFLPESMKYWDGFRCLCYCKRATAKAPYRASNLLQTCRQIHNEYLDTFYGQIAVQFDTFRAMTEYLPKPPNNHLNYIRTIDMSWSTDSGIYDNRLRNKQINKIFVRKNVHYYKKARQDEANWEIACETLSKMPQLSNLRIFFLDAGWKQSEADLLAPLVNISGLKSFLVLLPWPEKDALEPLTGVLPFTIVRPIVHDPELPSRSSISS